MAAMFLIAALHMFPADPASAAAGDALRAGSRVELAVPPTWDDDTKTVQTPDSLTVQSAGSIDTCSFHGGSVTVKKIENDKVYFDPAAAAKGACSHLVTSLEWFRSWRVESVKSRKAEWEKKATDFRKQLLEDVKGIVEKGGDPCAPQDKELKTGSVYKVTGRVFLYGPGTAATAVGGDQCQVELGSFVEVLGFNRASDHAVAVYHRPEGSAGKVPVGPRHVKTETCADGQQVVFSLTKLKEHFHFAQPSTKENLEVKGIAAVLNPQKKVCINVTDERSDASSSHGRKLGRSSSDDVPDQTDHGSGEPADGSTAR